MRIERNRIGWVMAACFLIAFLIFSKMLYVQVLANDKYSGDALHNRLREIPIKPNRGIIYGANGEALAVSVEKNSIYITPSVLKESKEYAKIVEDLSKAVNLSKEDVEKIINGKNQDFAWLKRHAEKDEVEKIKDLNYMGVGYTPEFKRDYPKGRLASQVLGYAGVDNTGLAGIELQYDDVLTGKEGKLIVETDKQGNIIPQSIRESIPSTPGSNIHLTIDETIQYIMERELNKAQTVYKAEEMIGLMMDVNTAEILGMVSLPDFDPNSFGDFDEKTWKNLNVSKVYEPGSTFKVLSASMSLEDDTVEVDTQFFCNGELQVDGETLRCWTYPDGNGAENFKQAIERSCNVAVGKTVLGLGKDRFYDYLHGFGMDKVTGIDLPGESSPIILSKNKSVRLDLAAMGIGQTNGFTPIQMLTAISANVNGGKLLKPHIVSHITDRQGNTTKTFKTEVVRQVISDETSKQIIDILEGVVTEGIGKAAKVPGYRVGGKTGTGETVVGGEYTEGVYHLSFAGFAPVENPKYACIIIVNHPKTSDNSGNVCGPIFSKIMEDTLRYKQIAPSTQVTNSNDNVSIDTVVIPDLSFPSEIETLRQTLANTGLNVKYVGSGNQAVAILPTSNTKVARGSTVEIYLTQKDQKQVTVPDLTGKTIKEVEIILRGYGLIADISGSGLAYRQHPTAGSLIEVNNSVSVWFASSTDIENIEKRQKTVQEDLEKKEKENQKDTTEKTKTTASEE